MRPSLFPYETFEPLRLRAASSGGRAGARRRCVIARCALALVAATSWGCQSPALVRTARTLPAGGHDLALSLNLTRVSLQAPELEGVPSPLREFNLPNPIPDVLYAYGLSDNFELGGRLALGSGLLELHGKYRFVNAIERRLHLALVPAAGYRALGLVNGPVLTLPLIVTYDLSPDMSLSGGPLLSYARYSVPESLDYGDLDLRGETLYAGGGMGIEFRPAHGIHLMPTLEVQRSISRQGNAANLPRVDMLFLGLTFGWSSRARR